MVGCEIIQKQKTARSKNMAIETILKRGLPMKHWMGRLVPALFACALVSVPLTGAFAKPVETKPLAVEIAGMDSPPVAKKFLLTAQLAQAEDDQNDPLEGFNRAIFSFNEGFYDVVMRPVAGVYNAMPSHIRYMINSFLSNLRAPLVFINDVLQGEFERAMTTVGRFAMNSTIGFAGIVDVASSAGFEEHDEDFGQTLAFWGVGEGFYLVLPVLGPSNPRDAIGRFVVDPWIDPVNYRLDETGNDEWIWARFGVSAVDQFAAVTDELDQIKKTSIDYYAAVRSLYRQKRKAEISNGEEMDLPPIPDFEFGDFPGYDEPEPALGGNGDSVTEDDQLSLREFDQKTDDKIIENPFEAQFVPAVSAREVADGDDAFRPAPRKPAEFDSVATEDAPMMAEMSWEAVAYRSDPQ